MTTTSIADFKHYQIRQALGEGGFGQVFEAWDSQLCRSVALKRLKNLQAPGQPAALVKEARMAASLQHAAFVQVHAIEDDGHTQSIVMELVRGLTLKQVLQAAPPTTEAAIDMLRQVAGAMRVAHADGLVHGDLKPSNLMLEPSGRVRILDFGLAAHADEQATTSIMQADPQGTISYMAPERLTGAPISMRTDVYALGVVFYELLTGARPFAGLSGLALAAAQVQSSSDQWPYPATLAPSLVALVRAMTARAPAQRLPDMAAVIARIDALGGATPPAGMPATAPPPARARATGARRKRLLAGAAAVLLAIGAWQSAPYWPVLQDAARPYSESQEMNQGLEALRQFDLPGELDLADRHFNAILAHQPNHAAASAGLSLIYAYRFMSDAEDAIWWRKADASAQQALALNGQLALSHIAKARVLELHGQRAPALEEVERGLALDPRNLFGLVAKVSILRGLARYDEARISAQQGAALYPQETTFPHFLGQVLAAQGRYADAEQSLRRAIALRPDSPGAYATLARLLLMRQRDAEALQVLQQGLQVHPSAMLYTNVGNVLFQQGDYSGAAAAFENAVAPDKGRPTQYLGWANLGDTLLWIPGRKDEARRAYDKARALLEPLLQRAPDDVLNVSRMGLYQARSGEADEAQRHIAHALQLAPKNAAVHFRAGLAYELIGKREAAIEQLVAARGLGYATKNIDAEPDLAALRRDPRYPQD